MRCPSCGYENKPDHTFCAQCLEILNAKSITAVGGKRNVAMPPQSDHLVDIKYSSAPTTSTPVWLWVVVILTGLAILLFIIYG